PDLRRVLRAASIFGDAFEPEGVARLLGAQDDARSVVAWLEALERHEAIAERADRPAAASVEYAFRHALVRDAAYGALTLEDRALGHRLAAQWLAARGEHDAMKVAEHFERGGVRERASEWYLRASEQALEANDFEVVIARTSRGIACDASGERLGALRVVE